MSAAFYDQLAPFYHLLYGDWDASIHDQGAALAKLLIARGVPVGARVLDAACGIGTQTLGLAGEGYVMAASDLSPGGVARLDEEAARRGLAVSSRVDDLRTLAGAADGSLDAVIACDNSIPHLLTDEALLQSFRNCLRVLHAGGLAVFSVRDYAAIPRVHPDVRPYGLRREGTDRFLAVQVWEWDGDQYDVRMYLTREAADGACSTQVMKARYYAVTIDRLLALMAQAGFTDLERLDDVLFQPVLVGRRPGPRTVSR
jgi:SAM-dependent methyltransferase